MEIERGIEIAKEVEGETFDVRINDGEWRWLRDRKIYIGEYEGEEIPFIKHNGYDIPVKVERHGGMELNDGTELEPEIMVEQDVHGIPYERGVLR